MSFFFLVEDVLDVFFWKNVIFWVWYITLLMGSGFSSSQNVFFSSNHGSVCIVDKDIAQICKTSYRFGDHLFALSQIHCNYIDGTKQLQVLYLYLYIYIYTYVFIMRGKRDLARRLTSHFQMYFFSPEGTWWGCDISGCLRVKPLGSMWLYVIFKPIYIYIYQHKSTKCR